MDFLGEILVGLFQIVLEVAVQIVFEMLGELLGHSVREVFRRPEPHSPWFAAVGYVVLGAAFGGLSLLVLPELFIKSSVLRGLSLVVTPIVAGLVMGAIGAWRRRRDKEVIRLESFVYGALFALAMGIVRTTWGH